MNGAVRQADEYAGWTPETPFLRDTPPGGPASEAAAPSTSFGLESPFVSEHGVDGTGAVRTPQAEAFAELLEQLRDEEFESALVRVADEASAAPGGDVGRRGARARATASSGSRARISIAWRRRAEMMLERMVTKPASARISPACRAKRWTSTSRAVRAGRRGRDARGRAVLRQEAVQESGQRRQRRDLARRRRAQAVVGSVLPHGLDPQAAPAPGAPAPEARAALRDRSPAGGAAAHGQDARGTALRHDRGGERGEPGRSLRVRRAASSPPNSTPWWPGRWSAAKPSIVRSRWRRSSRIARAIATRSASSIAPARRSSTGSARLNEGEDPRPAVEQFVPAVLAALRIGIKLLGRPKVVGFLSGHLANFIKPHSGPTTPRTLSNALVDAGLRLVQLEAESEDGARAAAETLATTLEDTVTRLANELPAEAWESETVLESYARDAFEKSAVGALSRRHHQVRAPRSERGEGLLDAATAPPLQEIQPRPVGHADAPDRARRSQLQGRSAGRDSPRSVRHHRPGPRQRPSLRGGSRHDGGRHRPGRVGVRRRRRSVDGRRLRPSADRGSRRAAAA